MILTGLVACDNVTWGGVELRLEAPPATDTAATATSDTVSDVERTLPPLDLPPSVFVVDRQGALATGGSTARLMPVALLGDDSLEPFPAPDDVERLGERFIRERMSPGRRFILYAGGARVGSFFPDSVGSIDAYGAPTPASDPDGGDQPGARQPTSGGPLCTPRPAVPGWLELLPEAAGENRLIALPEEAGVDPGHGSYVPRTSNRDQRVAALNLASAIYVIRDIVWPPSVTEARRDMRVFQLPGGVDELIAATFLYGDSLAVGPAPSNAYSLFFIGRPPDGGGRYQEEYVRYREVGPDGKSVPRWINHVDWDGDQEEDVLLEVFGETGRSFAALTRTETGWEESFEEGCPAPPPAVALGSGSPSAGSSAAGT